MLQLCYYPGVASSTSSFRISDDLKARLEHAARSMSKGKNWVINQALKEYLDRHGRESLKAEARRQSLLASRKRWSDGKLWEAALREAWNDK